MMETGNAQRQTEIKDIFQSFEVQGKRLNESLSRLKNISNRLSVSDELQKGTPNNLEAKRSPGILNDFRTISDGFASLITEMEIQLSNLETKI